MRLSAVDADTTEFELTHRRAVDKAKWDQFGPGSVGVGWDLPLLTSLPAYLAGTELTGQPEDFMRSAEFVALTNASVDAWVAAHREAGALTEEAGAAGEQTRRFYLPPAE